MAHQICTAHDESVLRAIIRNKARGLVGKARLTKQDRQDIEQDLAVGILKGLPGFDPSKSPRDCFLHLLADCAASNLLRDRLAQKRSPPPGTSSFDQIDTHTWQQCLRRSRLAQQAVDNRLDCEALLARLPPADRNLLVQLMSSTLAELARAQNIPTSTMRSRLAALKKRFWKEWEKNE